MSVRSYLPVPASLEDGFFRPFRPAMKRIPCALLAVLGLFCVCTDGQAAPADESSPEKAVTYERDVRPILKAYCFQCHGEEKKLEGELDVRLRRLILKGGESGPAIVPGEVDESYLYEQVATGEMPPGDMELAKAQIDTIAAWIKQGAKTARPEPDKVPADGFTEEEREFWSLQPIVRHAVPDVAHKDRVRTPIDAFLLKKLEAQKLSFSPDADKRTLIRRLSFDLLGLPPTPEQIAEYVGDASPGAYERLVDRLLASPRYGERWGRHWLDVAGYADSEGYTDADLERDSAFRYRDYVIRSLNADKPFDLFIQEQLAGDEMIPQPYKNLSDDQVDKLVATGYLRMAPDGTGSGGIDQSIARNQVMSQTLGIVSTSLMGMTVGCAECHDHRYDPISQADYFRLRAVFEPAYDWKKWRTPAGRRISLYTDDDREAAAAIEVEAKKVDAERQTMTQTFIDQTLDVQLLKLEDESVRDPLRVAYKTPGAKRTAEQNDLLAKFPGIRQISAGSLYLYDREIRTDAAKLDRERAAKEKEFVAKTAAAELAKHPAELQAKLKAAKATAAAKRTPEQKTLLAEHPGVLVTAATLAQFDKPAADALAALKKQAVDLRATQKADRVKVLTDKAAAIRATKPAEGFVRPLTEIPGHVPPTFLFHRGSHEQPKQQLNPGGLSVLAARKLSEIPVNDAALPTTGRRLAFARRLTSGSHPLTARVLVNRFWLHHFGRGIVETPGDFGALGTRPTHPKLLDWLAAEFMEGGWKLKQLHKLMVTSTAYRQSSRRNPAQDAVDPGNALLGRMSIRRLEAEIIRDAVLAIGGKLNEKMHGPPVPVMEDDVGQIIIGKENLDGERKPGQAIDMKGEELRRSIYVQVRRSRPLGMLDTFDAPAMAPNCLSRNSSTVATQALMFMNSQFAVDYAGLIAQRVQTSAGADVNAQAKQAWALTYGREPTDEQIASSLAFLTEQAQHYAKNRPTGVKTEPQLLALGSFCQALISSNGFLYVD